MARERRLFRQFLVLAGLVTLIGYVASDTIRGHHGLAAHQQLRARISALSKELTALKAERGRLERDEDLLTAKAASEPSLIDEQVRSLLDLALPTDIVIINSDKAVR
ncbi:MAG: septum formation initiator family protein [Rhodomicrobium sp.]